MQGIANSDEFNKMYVNVFSQFNINLFSVNQSPTNKTILRTLLLRLNLLL